MIMRRRALEIPKKVHRVPSTSGIGLLAYFKTIKFYTYNQSQLIKPMTERNPKIADSTNNSLSSASLSKFNGMQARQR